MCRTRAAVTSIKRLAETKWLRLETLQYNDPTGKSRKWDRVTRSTKSASSAGIDAVTIFPILKDEGDDMSTILVKQFRPPLDAWTIELPAGLIDEGETPEEAAIRELREETGYVGDTEDCRITGALPLSPGLSDETIALVTVPIDLTRAENQTPKQDRDDLGRIDLMKVPLASLKSTLDDLHEDGSVHVFLGLHCIAMGLEWGKSISLH